MSCMCIQNVEHPFKIIGFESLNFLWYMFSTTCISMSDQHDDQSLQESCLTCLIIHMIHVYCFT